METGKKEENEKEEEVRGGRRTLPEKARDRDGPPGRCFFFFQLKGQEKIEQISVCGFLLNVSYVLNAYFVGEHYTEKQ